MTASTNTTLAVTFTPNACTKPPSYRTEATGPDAVELGSQTEFDPDLVVVRMDQIGGAKFTEPPLLVVEIRSPSTALIDLNRKKAAYERFGVPSYWMLNPDPPQLELTVFELREGRYALAAKTSGPFAADRPFTVSIDPARLTDGLRH